MVQLGTERPLGSSKRHREGQVVDSSQADLPPTVVRRLQRTRSIDLAGVQGPEQLRRDAGMVRRSPTSPPSERELHTGDVQGSGGDKPRDAGHAVASDTRQGGDEQTGDPVPSLQQTVDPDWSAVAEVTAGVAKS